MTNKQAAIKVVKVLRRSGFEALLAGGCVRDMLLRRRANDYDVATDARPDEVAELFNRTLKVGVKFGVVIVLIRGMHVEVATFRTDADYADGRHPVSVRFASAAEDAGRRDFTINGMFFEPIEKKVIDYVGGRADLKKRLIRTIGNAQDRFAEDHLRMLRAVRFSTQLGFAIEPATFAAICRQAGDIKKISGERIAMELEGILASPNRSAGAAMLIKGGLAEQIFDGFVGEKAALAVGVLGRLPKKIDFASGLAGLFAGLETEPAVERLRILRLSNKQKKHVKYLLANRGRLLKEKMSLAELKQFLAEPYFEDLFSLERALQEAGDGKGLAALNALRGRIDQLGDIELRPAPLLNGHALARLGAVAGPELGQLAQEMYIAQLEGELQTGEEAERWVRKWLIRHRESQE
ncbi:MAG TPA: CCA tRNA nucleotidyltransferase [Sedimentisphaerales bacterium]|nr:CCA tRNA nucleotidyltransferase [Sedimentisphaerales bacterium]